MQPHSRRVRPAVLVGSFLPTAGTWSRTMLTTELAIEDYVGLARDRKRSPEERASFLAQAFHVLREADGVAPFNAHALSRWACGPASTNASRQCAAFVLSVYNMHTKWKCGPFNVAY